MNPVVDGSVLVTGASGYIGSELVRRLANAGIAVKATARSAHAALAQQLGVPVSPLDVMGPLPDLDGIETVVHCATPNDIMSRSADGGIPLAVMGTRALIEHAAQHGVKRFVYLSTLQVYGTELSGTIDEATPAKCESLYGLNHYLGEEVCRYQARVSGMDVVVLRPANVYGVPAVSTVDRWTLVPMCFVREARRTGSLALRSSGKQRRNFVSTGEVADLIAALLMDFPAGYTIVNSASDWYCSIIDVAGFVAEGWRRESGKSLEVRVLSDQPAAGNQFIIESRWAHLRPTPETSRQAMKSTIDALLRSTDAHQSKEPR